VGVNIPNHRILAKFPSLGGVPEVADPAEGEQAKRSREAGWSNRLPNHPNLPNKPRLSMICT
jgi:hypothetical protein